MNTQAAIEKRLISNIWKVLVLNDPPSWTREQRMEWLVNRVDEVLEAELKQAQDRTIKKIHSEVVGEYVKHGSALSKIFAHLSELSEKKECKCYWYDTLNGVRHLIQCNKCGKHDLKIQECPCSCHPNVLVADLCEHCEKKE